MTTIKRLVLTLPMAFGLLTPIASVSVVHAAATIRPAVANSTTAGSGTNTDQATRLTNMKQKGDQEITRRLNALSKLTDKITAAAKLSASDKAALSSEVSSEITGLTTLKAKLDAETTVAGAAADVQSMVTEYRVYALIVPKVQLIKTADDQQAVESKLTDLATKLQARLTTAQTQGKDVSALQTKLTDMNTQIATAQAISAGVEVEALALQPSDYNADHAIVSSYRNRLQTAHQDNQAAYQDAKAIVSGLKSL
ncbi:MAG TPA: hypothetical protein VLF91_04400 [Candidatus Saccharimonadales bacterium]|nr:hypothetical protein [Candidatus Saccharimonadales bacterium]